MFRVKTLITLAQNALKSGQDLKNILFNKHLLLTNVSISVCLSGLGDVLQQHYSIIKGDLREFDSTRAIHMSTSGATVGVLCHHWYNYLDAALPGRGLSTVLRKVLVDQILFSPVCISVFFITVGVLERSSGALILQEILDKGSTLYRAEWFIWPPAQLINFYWLPTKFRVLYDNTISLGYDVYTSHVKHNTQSAPS